MPNSKQRRAAEQRRLRRQLQRRQERQVRRRRLNLVLSVVGTLVVAAVIITFIIATNHDSTPAAGGKGSGTPTASTAASPTPTTSTSTTPTSTTSGSATSSSPTSSGTAAAGGGARTVSCTYTKSGTASRKVSLPPRTASHRGTTDVRLQTSQGTVTFALNRAAAPCTVNSFVSLVRQKYFDRTRCHRLVTQGIFVLQCGDPTGTGTGGPGYRFDDELTGNEQYTRGVLAMANSGANTNGSQFFVVYKQSTLGPQYTIFGTVSAGLPVIDKVAAAGTTNGSTDGQPKLPLIIRSATVAG